MTQSDPKSLIDNQTDLLTTEEVADRLRVGVKTVRRYIAAGRLKAYRLPANKLRCRKTDVDALLVPVTITEVPEFD